MMLSKAVAMQAHFAPATQSDTHEFFSSFTKGLRDSRAATHRDPNTGRPLPGAEHDSWVGALGYLALLDQIGTSFVCKGRRDRDSTVTNPLVLALRHFTEMSDDEIAAIFALRCAFAHDFSLFNVHPSRPELTHCFHLFGEPDGALVTLPKSRWNGDYSHRPSECRTSIGLTLLGNLVEGICARLPDMARSGELLIRLAGGPDELNHRYGLMKVRSRQTES